MSLLVIADGAPSAALGHLARASSLVVALRTRGAKIRCLALEAAADVTIEGVEWEPLDRARVLAAAHDARSVLLDTYRLPEHAVDRTDRVVRFWDGAREHSVNAAVV